MLRESFLFVLFDLQCGNSICMHKGDFIALGVSDCSRICNREKRCQAAVFNSTSLQCTLYNETNGISTGKLSPNGVTYIVAISALKLVSCFLT